MTLSDRLCIALSMALTICAALVVLKGLTT